MESVELRNIFQVRELIGRVFEEVAADVLGAKRVPGENFKEGDVHPDLMWEEGDAWVEVKAGQDGHFFKVYLAQIEKYLEMMQEPFPFSRLLYMFFSHNLYSILPRYRDSFSLACDIVLHTVRVVVLDFSAVWQISRYLPAREYSYCGYPRMVTWPHWINRKLGSGNPEAVFKKYDLDPRAYVIAKEEAVVRNPAGQEKIVPIIWVLPTEPPEI